MLNHAYPDRFRSRRAMESAAILRRRSGIASGAGRASAMGPNPVNRGDEFAGRKRSLNVVHLPGSRESPM